MEYISSDTNVWIDFYKISQTQLPFRMNCKYIMFHEAIEKELLYTEDLKFQLIEGGLLGVEITTEELFYTIFATIFQDGIGSKNVDFITFITDSLKYYFEKYCFVLPV